MPEPADASSTTSAEKAWFTEVVREHSTALVRYFARRGPRQDAEDLAAEVFATAWRRRADVPREAVLPWLYRTAGFTLANGRRKHVDLPVDEVPETRSVRIEHDPELSAKLSSSRERYVAVVSDAVARLGARDPDAAAAAVMSVCEGLNRHRIARGDASDPRPAIAVAIRGALAD